MFDTIKQMLLGSETETKEYNAGSEKKLQTATYALFIELAYSDDEFSAEERTFIHNLIKSQFGLSEDEMSELSLLAEQRMKSNVSLYDYTDIINHHFSTSEKYEVLKNLWRLILVDGKLDAHEEYFIRKVSGNLHMEHKDLIAAKLEIKKEMNL